MVKNKIPASVLLKKALCYLPIFIVLCFFAFIMLAPLLWLIMGAFKSTPEVIEYPPKFFPTANHFLETWKRVQTEIDLIGYAKNTIIYAIGRTVPSMLINSIAGYAFARFAFKGKNIIFLIFLATMMIPFQVIMVPLYLEVYYLGWLNTYWGLIIPGIASVYWIFLCRSAFQGLPVALEDAARIDGCSEFKIYWMIMLPLVKPTMITMMMLGVNGCWNDLMWPLIVANSSKMRTISNGIAVFVGDRTDDYSQAFLCSFISMLPMLVLYVFGQKYFVKGQATSGIKG